MEITQEEQNAIVNTLLILRERQKHVDHLADVYKSQASEIYHSIKGLETIVHRSILEKSS